MITNDRANHISEVLKPLSFDLSLQRWSGQYHFIRFMVSIGVGAHSSPPAGRLTCSMKRWSGIHLRYMTMHFSPYNIFYTDPKTGQLRSHGLMGSLIGNITASMNMTYSVVEPPDNLYGQVIEKTQTFSGMPKFLLEDQADITGPFPVHPLYQEQFYILARTKEVYTDFKIISGMERQYTNTPTSFTDAFDPMTWYILGAAYLCSFCVLVSYNWFIHRDETMTYFDAVSKWSFSLFAALLQEATSEKPPKRWFERLFQGLWLVTCTLISYTFLGTLKANLIVLTPTERIDNMEHLLERPDLTIYYASHTPAERLLFGTPGELGDRLREHLRLNSRPVAPYPNIWSDEVRDALAKKTGIVMMEEKSMKIGMSKWCVQSPYYFYFGEKSHSRQALCMLASRKMPSELRKDIDLKILWLHAFDVPFVFERELLEGHLGCLASRDKKTSEETISVQMKDFSEIYRILVLAQAVAVIIFLVELIVSRWERKFSRGRI